MSAVFVTSYGELSPAAATRVVRNAMRVFAPATRSTEAYEVVEVVRRDGFAFIGEGHPADCSRALDTLREGDCKGEVFVSAVEGAARLKAKVATALGASPEDAFADREPGTVTPIREGGRVNPAEPKISDIARRTSLAVLAQANGNPMQAGGYVANLMRATEQQDFYMEVVHALNEVFPWVLGALRKDQLIP